MNDFKYLAKLADPDPKPPKTYGDREVSMYLEVFPIYKRVNIKKRSK